MGMVYFTDTFNGLGLVGASHIMVSLPSYENPNCDGIIVNPHRNRLNNMFASTGSPPDNIHSASSVALPSLVSLTALPNPSGLSDSFCSNIGAVSGFGVNPQ